MFNNLLERESGRSNTIDDSISCSLCLFKHQQLFHLLIPLRLYFCKFSDIVLNDFVQYKFSAFMKHIFSLLGLRTESGYCIRVTTVHIWERNHQYPLATGLHGKLQTEPKSLSSLFGIHRGSLCDSCQNKTDDPNLILHGPVLHWI